MMFLERKHTLDQLIKGCKEGQRKMQEELYKLFAAKMLGVCMRYANDKMEGEDMLQNGFIKVFQKINDYRGEGSFEGWMRRIMVHTSIEYFRKHHKMMQMVELDEQSHEPSVDAMATSNLGVNELMKLIQQLSAGYRLVFNLYAIEGYSHKEISIIMGITEGASKSQLSRARNILKEQILMMEGSKHEYVG
jgi:RNA polymerase sigma factor (sigma-70 family)